MKSYNKELGALLLTILLTLGVFTQNYIPDAFAEPEGNITTHHELRITHNPGEAGKALSERMNAIENADTFADVGKHYNPQNCPHPAHAGDMPPFFSNNGYAVQMFLTDRFTVEEIIGKTIIVHSGPDDFTSQPAGNAGMKIACGEIIPGVY